MAEAGTTPKRERPLSPHISIWKPGPAMAVSILHRISGDGLALVGLPLLLWWLYALASGPAAYDTFVQWVWAAKEGSGWVQGTANVLGKIALLVFIILFIQKRPRGLFALKGRGPALVLNPPARRGHGARDRIGADGPDIGRC